MLICLQPLSFTSNQTDSGMGHVSEKTDAYAMGIVIIELLISGSMTFAECPEDYPLKARTLVDIEDMADLPSAIEAMAVSGAWADANARRAAKVLIDVAVCCTGKAGKRKTPAGVLDQIEGAYQLTQG
jgi:hypothetical protein